MINVVAVNVGDYQGRGYEYVERLFDGVAKFLRKGPARFWCITDEPENLPRWVYQDEAPWISPLEPDKDVRGWWNKIALFRPGILPVGERALYFDLDTIIRDDISDLASYDGKFAALTDFYFKGNMNSGLMGWEVGTQDHIWRVWDRCGRPQFDPGGDQSWIESVQGSHYDHWQTMQPNQIVSYKLDCQQGVPDNTRVICFHGQPRPHEVNWLEGGHDGN